MTEASGHGSRPVLDLRDVRKSYGDHVAVEGVDLSLHPEEFVTFLGPSGSGKTTTLMMVAGLQQPDAGTIELSGRPVDRLPPYRRDIGMVFQHYALFPHMSVRRNVAFPLEMRHLKRAEVNQQVAEALDLVGLVYAASTCPAASTGCSRSSTASPVVSNIIDPPGPWRTNPGRVSVNPQRRCALAVSDVLNGVSRLTRTA